MACFVSTSCFGPSYLEEALVRCGKLSMTAVEISAPHHYQQTDQFFEILRRYEEIGFRFTFHNYFPPPKEAFVLNIASEDKKVRDRCKTLVEEALSLASLINVPLYGIHAGYLASASEAANGRFLFEPITYEYTKALSNGIRFVNEIASSFEKKGVKLLIENLFPSQQLEHSLFCSFDQMKDFMSEVPDSVGFLLDLGHLNIASTIMEFDRVKFIDSFLSEYGNRLFEVHLSENNGLEDQHLAIESKSWQLEIVKLINQLKKNNGNDICYCVEARCASENQLISSINLVNEIII